MGHPNFYAIIFILLPSPVLKHAFLKSALNCQGGSSEYFIQCKNACELKMRILYHWLQYLTHRCNWDLGLLCFLEIDTLKAWTVSKSAPFIMACLAFKCIRVSYRPLAWRFMCAITCCREHMGISHWCFTTSPVKKKKKTWKNFPMVPLINVVLFPKSAASTILIHQFLLAHQMQNHIVCVGLTVVHIHVSDHGSKHLDRPYVASSDGTKVVPLC